MKRTIFRSAAAADVEDAYAWYEDQRPGLGDEFAAEVTATRAGHVFAAFPTACSIASSTI